VRTDTADTVARGCRRRVQRDHVEQLSLGVVARSRKPNEYRLPIHPAHLDRIDPSVRRSVFLEVGYGEHFGVADKGSHRSSAASDRESSSSRSAMSLSCPSRPRLTWPTSGQGRCCGAGRTASRTRP
jgi:hypothetical protein